jgi:hypothetical protein
MAAPKAEICLHLIPETRGGGRRAKSRMKADRQLKVYSPQYGFQTGRTALFGQYRRNWGEDRVYFQAADGDLTSIPATWTNLCPTDPFVAVSAGRSLFRADDLLELAVLVSHFKVSEQCRRVK